MEKHELQLTIDGTKGTTLLSEMFAESGLQLFYCSIVNHRVEKSPAECLENLMVFIQIQHACSTLIIQNNSQVFPCSVEVQIEAEFILVP